MGSASAAARVLPAGDRHVSAYGLGIARGGRWLVHDMSWEVPRGAFVAVTGPSGAGKSSVLACLAGMLDPSAGGVRYHAVDRGRSCPPAAMRGRIGVVFQQLMLTANAPALTNVLCGRLGRYPAWRTALGFPRADRAAAREWLRALDLDRYAAKPVAILSGGEQQRVAVARGLFQEPEVLLADEPVSNLDPALGHRVLGMFREVAATRGCTVFCVLHSAELVRRYADYELALHPERLQGWTMGGLG